MLDFCNYDLEDRSMQAEFGLGSPGRTVFRAGHVQRFEPVSSLLDECIEKTARLARCAGDRQGVTVNCAAQRGQAT